MKKQMSQLGIWTILTLLMLGFFHKRSYGNIPVSSKNLSEFFFKIVSSSPSGFNISLNNQINSLFIRPEGKHSKTILMLVAYNEEVTKAVRRILQTNETPLIFSVSTLPSTEVFFDPTFLQFEQDDQIWQPNDKPDNYELFPLGKNAKFGGKLNDADIHQGVILLPEWFDINHPITIRYISYERMIFFLTK